MSASDIPSRGEPGRSQIPVGAKVDLRSKREISWPPPCAGNNGTLAERQTCFLSRTSAGVVP